MSALLALPQVLATFDHTWLPPLGLHPSELPSPEAHVTALCAEAVAHGFAAVCVRPEYVPLARQALGVTSPVQLATVIGFPAKPVTLAQHNAYPVIGACESTTKLQEICLAHSEGADELDVVMNVAYFLTDCETGGSFTQLELKALAQAADTLPIKLIIETDCLTPEQVVRATQLAVHCGMATVKTSTGYLSDGVGATVEVVSLIKQTLGTNAATGIKASGGIKTPQQVLALLQAGATRIGSSRCVALAEALKIHS
jgi:deoxyribose-phosphate aldolase